MLSRWFFRWGQSKADFDLIANTPICGAFGVHKMSSGATTVECFLTVTPRRTVVIGFHPSFWKYNKQSWYRSAVRAVAYKIAGMEPDKSISEPTLMIWSNDEAMLPAEPGFAARARAHSLVVRQAETMWGWIGHVVTQPIARQRSASLHEEFDEWELKTRGARQLPSMPQVR